MNKLWVLLAISLALAKTIDQRDRVLTNQGRHQKEITVTWVLILLLAFFCGLRTFGNDTVTYLQMYSNNTPTLNELSFYPRPSFASGIGFYYTNCLLKTLRFSRQDFLMFYAFATAIPYVLFVRRYSRSMLFGVFLMFTTGFYTFSLAAIKQCMATGICLMAVTAALEGKRRKYISLVALASLYHPYAMVYFIVPLMMFKPWTSRTFFYMAAFVLVAFLLQPLLRLILDITDMMGATYDEASFTGEGVNIFRVAVSFVPLILASLYGEKLFADSTKADNLMFNLAMLNALIMFVGLFGTANYFARLANYFLPAQIIVIPWILQKARYKDKLWLVPLCVVGFLGYFIYENAIIRPFDINYPHRSFWGYLISLFS